MNKCIASKDGVCQNLYACGLKCDGYSGKCKMKLQYDKLYITFKGIKVSLRNFYGIVSDKEKGGTK